MTLAFILLLLALVFAGLAAFNVASDSRVHFGWLGFACYVASILAGGV